MDKRADGTVLKSDYSFKESTTAVPIYHEDSIVKNDDDTISGTPEIASIDFGNYVING